MALKGTELQWLWSAVDKLDLVNFLKETEEERQIKETFPMNYLTKEGIEKLKVRIINMELPEFQYYYEKSFVQRMFKKDLEQVPECPICVHISTEREVCSYCGKDLSLCECACYMEEKLKVSEYSDDPAKYEVCFYCGKDLEDPNHSIKQCTKEADEAIRQLEYTQFYREQKLQTTFSAIEGALNKEANAIRAEGRESLSKFHFFLQMSTMTFDALVEEAAWVCCRSVRESDPITTSSLSLSAPFMAIAVIGVEAKGCFYPNLRTTTDLQGIYGTILFEYNSSITDNFPVQIDDSLPFGKAVIRKNFTKDS